MELTLAAESIRSHHQRVAAIEHFSKISTARSPAKMLARRRGREEAELTLEFPAQEVGATTDGRFKLFCDTSLGQAGLDVANSILPRLDKLFADNDQMFTVRGTKGNIIIGALGGRTDGLGGGKHWGGGFNDTASGASDWYVDVALGNPDLTFGIVQAEASESYMDLQNKGWDGGGSNGEALSRFLAQLVTDGPDGVTRAYGTGREWARNGFPNWIDQTIPGDNQHGDTVMPAVGCGVVYLYWMLSMGFLPTELVQAGCPDGKAGSLRSNYQALTGKTTAWNDFTTAVRALPNGVNGDDPWGASASGDHLAQSPGAFILTIDPVAKTITVPTNGYKIILSSG